MFYHLNLGILLSNWINNWLGGNILKLIILFLPISVNHTQVLWILLGAQTFNLTFLSKGTYLINPTLLAIFPQTLHNRICQDCLLICRLLTVLLVYLQDFLPKITSFHKWTDSCLFWPPWIYQICLGSWTVIFYTLLIGMSSQPNYYQTFLSLTVDRERTRIIMLWLSIFGFHPIHWWMTP